jgi:outer membrane lipoprotein-sorting protein
MNSAESRFRDLLNEPPFDDSSRKEHREQLRQQVLEAFDAVQADRSRRSVPHTFLLWREIMTRPAQRFAAAALVIATVCAVFIVMFQTQTTVAFANLVEPILKAKTARFNTVIEGKVLPKQTFRTLVLEPNRLRQEMADGQIQIMDSNTGRMLMLTPAQKSATLINLTGMPDEQKPANFFHHLRAGLGAAENDGASKKEPLGRKQIAGREAIGFRLTQPYGEATIWGDAKTGFPIVVEMKLALLPDTKVTMTDFEFDVELDEALFKTEAPDGYSLEKLNVTPPAEKTLIAALKLLSDHNEGRFPDTFDRAAVVACMTNWVHKNPGEPNAAWKKKVMDLSMSLNGGLVFAATLPAESNARYAGKGVKYNDATAAVFWYKSAGASNYRVIYGDLSVKVQKAAPEAPNGVPVKAANADWAREIMNMKKLVKPPLTPPPVVEPPLPPPAPPLEQAAEKISDAKAKVDQAPQKVADAFVFLSRITKIETKDGKTTITGKTGKLKVENVDGRIKFSPTGEAKEFSLSVSKDVKVAIARFNKDDKKFEAGDAIKGGLKNDIFKIEFSTLMPVSGYLTTEKDTVTQILVTPTPAQLLLLKQPMPAPVAPPPVVEPRPPVVDPLAGQCI